MYGREVKVWALFCLRSVPLRSVAAAAACYQVPNGSIWLCICIYVSVCHIYVCIRERPMTKNVVTRASERFQQNFGVYFSPLQAKETRKKPHQKKKGQRFILVFCRFLMLFFGFGFGWLWEWERGATTLPSPEEVRAQTQTDTKIQKNRYKAFWETFKFGFNVM